MKTAVTRVKREAQEHTRIKMANFNKDRTTDNYVFVFVVFAAAPLNSILTDRYSFLKVKVVDNNGQLLCLAGFQTDSRHFRINTFNFITNNLIV